MSCKICGRGACCTSFHSIDVQEKFEKLNGMTEDELKRLVVELRDELEEANVQIETMNEETK